MRDFVDYVLYLFPEVVEGVELVRHDIDGHIADELDENAANEAAGYHEQRPGDSVCACDELPGSGKNIGESVYQETGRRDEERKGDKYRDRKPAPARFAQVVEESPAYGFHP